MRVPVEEALRYIGAKEADADTRRLAEDCARIMESRLSPRFLWRAFRIRRGEGRTELPEAGITLPGKLAGTMLTECSGAVLLACTLGAGFERMMKEWESRDMARAAMMDACGSAWTEAACDEAEREIGSRFPGEYMTDRFSPGYGDLPLDLQADILRALDAERKLGLTVNGSCLLMPAKSVTAILGLSGKPQGARIRGCAFCLLQAECEYRKEQKFCGNETA